jgi:transposase
MSQTYNTAVAVVGIDIGKNSFHVVGHDARGAIVLRQKWSRGQSEARFANMPPCLIGMEACVGAHHLSRKLKEFGHDARLMPAQYVRPYSKGQKNDFNDAEAIAEAVQRPTMKFVATKTGEQLDLQALHRVRERLVSQRTGIINQIRAFLLERGVAVRQGLRFLRAELMSCHHAWCGSSRAWLAIGAGSMSGSRACRARSQPSRVRIPVASG